MIPNKKYGRKPPKNAPALHFRSIRNLGVTIPSHPTSEDYLKSLPGWQMLGNDQYGDCVAVTWANERRIVTGLLGGHAVYPTMDQVIQFYKTQNPGFPSEDNGMDIQTALEYLVSHGGPDGVKAVAFAKVDTSNLEEVKAALAIFGTLWTGIVVQDANETQFSKGQVWDYVPSSPDAGGHSIMSGGYLGQAASDVRFITWATETGFTDNYWAHKVEEAWVVIWPEHLGTASFMAGVNIAQLAQDYQAITGKTLTIPNTPPPNPTPTPNVDPALKTFHDAVVAWVNKSHTGETKVVADACRALFKAYNL